MTKSTGSGPSHGPDGGPVPFRHWGRAILGAAFAANVAHARPARRRRPAEQDEHGSRRWLSDLTGRMIDEGRRIKGVCMAPADTYLPRSWSTGASWLLATACLLYLAMMFLVLSEPVGFDCGDPASCGITKGLGAMAAALGRFCALLLWMTLAILLFGGSAVRDETTRIVAAILLLLSGVATIYAAGLYARYAGWAIATPALLPPLIALYAIRARLPGLQARLPTKTANIAAFGAILVMTIAPIPLSSIDARSYAARGRRLEAEREASTTRMREQEAQERKREIAAFQALTADSPLGDYLHDLYYPFPYAAGEAHHQEALTRARQVRSRQADAALLLRQGKIEWLEDLWRLDIEATPTICGAYNDALRQEAAKIDPALTTDQDTIERQLPNMKWLVGAHCDLGALALVEARFHDWCGRHQCRRDDIADNATFAILDTLAAFRQSR